MQSTRQIGLGAGDMGTVVRAAGVTFAQLAARLGKPKAGEKAGGWWTPAAIQAGRRCAERVESVSYLALDVEAEARVEDGVKRVIGEEPPHVDAMLAELSLHGWRAALHTSFSHTAEHPRYRLVFDLSRPLQPTELRPLGLHVAALLGIHDCFDKGALEPARLFYLPRCPEERLPLFRCCTVDGSALPVDELLAAARREAEAAQAQARRTGRSGNVIESFCAAHDVAAILEKHGYVPRGRRRWLWPGSTTGMPGVRLLDDGRVYSSHGGDLLNDGYAHDCFDVFRLLEHGGDMSAAVRAAAELLGMCGESESSSSNTTETKNEEWPEPQQLVTRTEALPYPLDALPGVMREAVAEVQAFVQAPVALVASCALGALSVAVQGYADVKRDSGLTGPSSVFLLAIAESGERKTKCDGYFSEAIRAWDAEQEAKWKAELKAHASAVTAWEVERGVVEDALKKAYKSGTGASKTEKELAELDGRKPEEPRLPRLRLNDETPEALAFRLAKQWPVAGVISSEAGTVFGSHGMGRDSVMRNLAQLNVLWEAGELHRGRRTTESFVLRNARLTVSLQTQERTLQSFFEESGGLARGTGFLARFLVCWPESTMGTRFYRQPPPSWPRLAAFNNAIAGILAAPLPLDAETGLLQPPVLALSPAAKAAWVRYHDETEAKLRAGGEFHEVSDVAAKSAECAARLAALFHVLERGTDGAITEETFAGAAKVAAWHLHESARFFGELALPVELAAAMRLDRWLIEHCIRERTAMVGKSTAMQYGPLRKRETLDPAIALLAELERIRVQRDRKRVTLKINPALLANAKVANFAKGEGNFSNFSNFSSSGTQKFESPGTRAAADEWETV